MFNMLAGGFILLLIVLGIALIIVSFFLKNKTSQIIVLTLGILFLAVPFLLSSILEEDNYSINQEETTKERKQYIGRYENDSSNIFIELYDNLTWQSDNSFGCSKGSWDFAVYYDSEELQIEGNCDNNKQFIEIVDFSPQALTFKFSQGKIFKDTTIILSKIQ